MRIHCVLSGASIMIWSQETVVWRTRGWWVHYYLMIANDTTTMNYDRPALVAFWNFWGTLLRNEFSNVKNYLKCPKISIFFRGSKMQVKWLLKIARQWTFFRPTMGQIESLLDDKTTHWCVQNRLELRYSVLYST